MGLDGIIDHQNKVIINSSKQTGFNTPRYASKSPNIGTSHHNSKSLNTPNYMINDKQIA